MPTEPISAAAPAAEDEYQAYLDRLADGFLSPSVRVGFDYWRSLLRGRHFPKQREIDPAWIPNRKLRVTLIEVRYAPLRFLAQVADEYVYRLQGIGPGTQILEGGRPDQSHGRVYRRCVMCVAQHRPIRGLYRFAPISRPHTHLWVEAAACPLSDTGKTIDSIVSFGADHDFKVPSTAKEWP